MFHQVRVLNPQGEIQKVFSAEQLSQRYWKKFMEEENNMGFRAQNNAKLFRKNQKSKN